MDKFVIEGGRPLRGEVRCSGSKNSALPILAATLLCDGECVIRGVPRLRDVDTLLAILGELGAETRREENGDIVTRVVDLEPVTARYELVSTMRASFCVLGPLVGRRRRARVSLPGGCVIGIRPVDLHIRGLRALGADVRIDAGYIVAEAPRLRGTEIYLGGQFGSTVTGTGNVLMAAVLAEGRTVIDNVACEPEVQDLARFLVATGARIEGIGTHRLVVDGVKTLHGVEWTVIPDRIEAGTFLLAGAITRGAVTVTGCLTEHVSSLLATLREIGVRVESAPTQCRVEAGAGFRPLHVTTLPYPGFPTDLQAQMMALLCLGDGISVVTERIYPDRFMHVAELNRMGADIRKEGSTALIHGVDALSGAKVMASDLRASAALVIAGLAAGGETEVQRVYHIDRGYDRIVEKLTGLGACMERVDDKKLVASATDSEG
ncbi:MAG: UDP-N-acetylglucosamine 1-carboxyvinyltransferase [Planctomycetes bacterium]|nr:UDP-N-acetylglucosamine 1-carboxyvinyltransferase [Planctomycetota bacterium]